MTRTADAAPAVRTKGNVNPNRNKTAARERQGQDIVQAAHKTTLEAAGLRRPDHSFWGIRMAGRPLVARATTGRGR
jgi:hypothetical protein